MYHYIKWVEINRKCNKLTDSNACVPQMTLSLCFDTRVQYRKQSDTFCRLSGCILAADGQLNRNATHLIELYELYITALWKYPREFPCDVVHNDRIGSQFCKCHVSSTFLSYTKSWSGLETIQKYDQHLFSDVFGNGNGTTCWLVALM